MHNKFTRFVVAAAVLPTLFISCTRKEAGPPTENTFRMAVRSKFSTLDPHFTTDVYSLQVLGLMVENLYEYDYHKRPLEMFPLLADGMPTVSKDFKTFTYKFKKGIMWQDHPCFKETGGKGRELTAEDMYYAVHRISSPKRVSPNYSSYEGLLVGADEYHKGKAPTISGLKLLDKYTIQFQLTRPSPRFTMNFTDPRTAPYPKECVESLGDDLGNTAVGTGAFKLVEYDPNSKAVAVKNPNYNTIVYPKDAPVADAGKKLPLLDKVVYEVLVEDQPRWLKFMAGEHDIVRVPKDNVGQVIPGNTLSEEFKKKGIDHVRELEADVTTCIFNMETPVWGEKKELRQAFSLALDREKLIRLNYGDQAIPAQSLINPGAYGYDPKFKSKYTTRDVAKAKELLAKAGYPEGKGLPVLEWPHGNGSILRQIAEGQARDLAEVGIKVKLMPMPFPEMSKGLREKKWMITCMGYAGSAPDVDSTLPHFHSKNLAPGANVANYVNPQVDKLIDEIDQMQNGPARLAKIAKVREILDEDMPYVPNVHRIGNHLVHKWVKNYVYTDESVSGQWMKYKRIETQGAQKTK